ncbi:MAG: xanthine dehydrogenase family protein molybdopterin-binding subunit [Pseudomonadota bacterium]|nr:xanthine dehydrogenase family protein molybdopterin-binding subunit [Pseudomonadota bacterium]
MPEGGPSIGDQIGRSAARPNAPRLAAGRGRYIDDIELPRMVHLAFLRSPYAHARILNIDTDEAASMPGVARILTGADIAKICTPWSGVAAHLPTLRSPPQYPMAVDRAVWQGEPVVAVAADTRAQAEDAAELVMVEWEDLPAMADMATALDADAPLAHPQYDSNLSFDMHLEQGDVASALANSDKVVERTLHFGRHTGLPLETRGVIADYDPSVKTLTVHAAHQSPWQQQDVLTAHFGLDEQNIRVIAPDVGGAFGIKLQVYGDEMTTVAASIILGRPVKFIADRLETFVSDGHSREFQARARIGIDAHGHVQGLAIDTLGTVGAYCSYRRIGTADGVMAVRFTGLAYDFDHYDAQLNVVFQNKPPLSVYRGVGQPLACAIGEQMVDLAAEAAEIDPVEMRRRNYLTPDKFPRMSPGGVSVEAMSLLPCLDLLVERMDYDALRTEQARLREQGVFRGIGVATLAEFTAIGPSYYGPAEARLTTQDGGTVSLTPSGTVKCITSVTDQGQGTWTGIAQIVADPLGLTMEDVSVLGSDSGISPYGGGAWASRGLTIGGEAAYAAACVLRENILDLAAAILQTEPDTLTLGGGEIRDAGDGRARMTLAELAAIGHFRQDTLPPGVQPQLSVSRQHVPQGPYTIANGAQGSWLEIDIETGIVRLLDHWMVGDCGRAVNPLLVDEQTRGGIVQGIGGALYEHLRYDDGGQLMNGTMADYLVPMAAELPDIHVDHVETLAKDTALGAKGVGEAGTVGAPAAILLGVNDALRPLGAFVNRLPITPDDVLAAIATASGTSK